MPTRGRKEAHRIRHRKSGDSTQLQPQICPAQLKTATEHTESSMLHPARRGLLGQIQSLKAPMRSTRAFIDMTASPRCRLMDWPRPLHPVLPHFPTLRASHDLFTCGQISPQRGFFCSSAKYQYIARHISRSYDKLTQYVVVCRPLQAGDFIGLLRLAKCIYYISV